MTTAQAQAIYDTHGTIDAVAAAIGMSRNRCYGWLCEHGVTLQRRGGWSKAHTAQRERLASGDRPGRAVRLICHDTHRLCVTHDLGADNCAACRARYEIAAGVRSTLEVEGMRR